jgi:SAM-dependent methyltransferase
VVGLFERYVDRAERVIEVGAGTGVVAGALQRAGYRPAVADVFPVSLEYCRKQGIEERYEFDVRKPTFEAEFDAVGLFDVLEHLEDEAAALAGVRRLLRAGGRVLVTVPAYEWLWSRSDALARHKRRYGFVGLRRRFEEAGFEVVYESGFFLSLLPALAVRRLLYPGVRRPESGAAPEAPVVRFPKGLPARGAPECRSRQGRVQDAECKVQGGGGLKAGRAERVEGRGTQVKVRSAECKAQGDERRTAGGWPGLAIAPVANDLFLGILSLEYALLHRLRPKFGASLALVGVKQ